METRANYVLIGVFTVLGILAGLGFFLWLAKVQVDRAYTRYDVFFETVDGLSQGSVVRYNGVAVGQVLAIDLDREDSTRVRVQIEVAATTPIRVGTEATLASQGVTGVAFVGLEGGYDNAPSLPRDPDTGISVIPSKPTVVQGLIEDAPDLLNEAISLLRDLSAFTTPENTERFTQIMANLERTTAQLDVVMADIGKATTSFSEGVETFRAFTGRLDGVAQSVEGVAQTADETLASAGRVLESLDAFANDGLPRATALFDDSRQAVAAIASLAARIERDPARFFLGSQTPAYNR